MAILGECWRLQLKHIWTYLESWTGRYIIESIHLEIANIRAWWHFQCVVECRSLARLEAPIAFGDQTYPNMVLDLVRRNTFTCCSLVLKVFLPELWDQLSQVTRPAGFERIYWSVKTCNNIYCLYNKYTMWQNMVEWLGGLFWQDLLMGRMHD